MAKYEKAIHEMKETENPKALIYLRVSTFVGILTSLLLSSLLHQFLEMTTFSLKVPLSVLIWMR